ncbi:P-loop containing nucleoside triphosphate hydrolase protein [Pelagophyceae sp. CCMP2097]|nr:P-loop containing nucleoside triphosphate hydrolase protein [Pelagophyceae sp. CCMP2097]
MSKLPVTVEKWDVVKFIWSYLWGRSLGQDALVITSATCLIAAKLLNVCVPFCLQRFVDAMAEGGSTAKAFTYLSYYCGTFLLVRLLGELRAMSFLRVSQRAAREFSDDVFAELLSKRADFHGAHPSGALAVAFGRAARGFSSLAFLFVFSVVPTILELGLSTSVLARRFQSPALGAVVVATFTLYAGFTAVFVELRIKSRKELAALEVEKGAALVDGLVNHEAVKLANAAASQVASFDRILERAEKASVWSQGLGSMLNAGQATIFGAGLCVALRLVASKAARGTEFSLGDIIATNALLMQLAQPMNFLGYTVSEIRQGLVDCNAMLGLVVHPGSKRLRRRGGPAAHVPPLDMTYGAIPPPRVEFDDVWLDRSAAEDGTGGAAPSTWSLRGATFSAPAGGVTLLCGASGSGKTSALRLCALLDGPPTRGTLKLWGADIRDIGDEAVRSRLAFVSQSTDLFDGTVAFNIAYGTGRDVVAVEAAATDACLDVDLAAGVGERGTKLSGGERQRVLIARALARNGRPLFLADEPTSAADPKTEKSLVAALVRHSHEERQTLLVVAHRLTAIAPLCDRVVVFKDGRVVEEGTHAELVRRKNGEYRSLWQASREVTRRS